MYSRMLRSILNTSAKLSKQKINKSTKLILSTSLTVPKSLACTNQYSVQNYSSNNESLNNDWSDEDLLNEQSSQQEYDSDELQEDGNIRCNPRNPKQYFTIREQEKLDALLKDPEMQKLKKIIELEMTVMEQEGECVPSQINSGQWFELLTIKSRHQRRKFMKYLFINEKVSEKTKKLKEERQIDLARVREKRKHQVPSDEIEYGFNKNFLIRRITNMYINNYHQWNSLRAIMFGNKLIYDCSYDQYMSVLEARSCARQIIASYSMNRAHNYPFEIFLTNVNFSSLMFETLHKNIPTILEKDFPFTITEKSYLELFDRSKLCYLSSNAPTALNKFDHDTIYIIGAYVDKGSKQPISFGKAKKEGLRMAKLPLDQHLKFGSGSGKDLTLNQVCCIMLDAQCESWKEAFKHVPTRKLYESHVRTLENRIKRHMMFEESQANNNATYAGHKNGISDSSTEERYRNRRFDSYDNTQNSAKSIFSSDAVTDYSHSARAKLREKWNK